MAESADLPAGRRARLYVMYTVYALISRKDNSLYIGLTSNLDRRIVEHNRGKTTSVKHKRPFEIFYTEICSTRPEARQREKFLKSGYGREYLGDKLRGWRNRQTR